MFRFRKCRRSHHLVHILIFFLTYGRGTPPPIPTPCVLWFCPQARPCKNTIIQSGPKVWLHLYIEAIPHFLRKQCFHIKCILFRQCYQYRINSISVIDGYGYIFKKASLYCIRLNNCWGVLQPNSPKHDPCLKEACIFIEKLKWPTSTVKKHWPLSDLTDHYKRYFGPGVLNVV